jgi:phosphotransferase system HPr (HPr) family protein
MLTVNNPETYFEELYNPMQSVELVVRHKVGLHARPAAMFVETAKSFASKITVSKNSRTVDAKSILAVLTLGVGQGDAIRITAEGPDEAEAVQKLQALIESNFGMPDEQ